MGTPLQALIVEDSEDDALLLVRELQRGGYDPAWERVETAAALQAALDRQAWDLILSDYNLPGFGGLPALALVRERDLDLPFILVSGAIGEETAVEAMRAGAHDYLMKANLPRLVPAIQRELREAEDRRRRREAEAALQHAAAEWRATFDAITDAIALVDPDGRVRRCNRALAQLVGKPFSQIIGQSLCKLLFGEAAEADDCPVKRTRETHRRETANVQLGDRWFDVAVDPMLAEAERLVGMVTILTDVTVRTQARRELEDMLRLYQATVGTMPSSLLVLDPELRIIMANQQYLATRGVELPDVLGQRLGDVFPAALLHERDLLQKLRTIASRGGRCEVFGVKHASSDHPDKYLNLRASGFQMAGRGEETHCVLLVIDDVTEQWVLEEQARQAGKMESIGRLASGVAHDFNNLLTGIIGFTEFSLAQVPPGSTVHHNLTKVRELGDRAAGLTRQLLIFGRRQPLEPVVLNLNALVSNALKLLQRVIGEDVEVRFVPAPELGHVRADPGQLEQVLMNLCVNARDAMPQGGTLTIATSEDSVAGTPSAAQADMEPGPYAMLAVSDTGCGMDAATRAQVFEPFFTTKEAGEGTGLGLATVYGIVRQHEGYVRVESAPGQGATFRAYLPRIAAEALDSAAPVEEEAVPRGSETILLVDDEDTVRQVVQLTLEALGYVVLSAGHPDEAERLFHQHAEEIDLLVADVVMPGVMGPLLYEGLDATRPGLKVLFMSGHSHTVATRHGALASGHPFVTKPVTPSALGRKVREVLDAPGPGHDA